MAISAALRSRGMTMDRDRKRAVLETMELGAHLNDRFDGDPHRSADLRKHLASFSRTFQRDCICSYIKRLRFLERSRPGPAAKLNLVKIYREHVNRVSFATLWAIASQRPIDAAEHDIQMESDLSILFRVVMLTQIIDDLLDIKKDRNRQLPSFATAIDSTPDALLTVFHSYRHPASMTWDSCFCLHALLRLAAGVTSAIMFYRRACGCFR